MALNVKEIRRKNLALLIEREGGPSELAKKVGCSPSYISQIMSTVSRGDVGDRFARKIEEKLGLELNWMDADQDDETSTGVPLAEDADVRALAAGGKFVPAKGRLRVVTDRGMSMRGFAYEYLDDDMQPRIPAGSRLIVEPEVEPRSGHICVIAGKNGVFVREIKRNPDGTLLLKPANAQYPAMIGSDDMQVVGVVRQAITYFA